MMGRTPPQIVDAADVPAAALEAFIMQELEAWGFVVEMRSGEYMVDLPTAGPLAIGVHRP